MKPIAIIYTSNAGHTKAYAELLGKKLHLPVYALKDAPKDLSKSSQIIYMGWLMAGSVSGYKKAKKAYDVACLVGVGMMPNGQQEKDIKEKNDVSMSLPVFSLQGGLDVEKLHGVYRMMMGVAKKGVTKGLSAKTDRTPEEEETLKLFADGADYVKEENLEEIIAWFQTV